MEKAIKEELGKKLLIACAEGKLRDVKKLVEKDKADVNYVGEGRITPLIVASAANNLKKVKYLLEHGADVNARIINEMCTEWREYRSTPLMMACANLNKEMIRCMVEDYNADVNIEGVYKNTSLMVACNMGNVDIILYLLDKGADPDRANGVLKTVLDFAGWSKEISKIIRDNINEKNKCLYNKEYLDILQESNLEVIKRKRKEDTYEVKSKRNCKRIPRENNSEAMSKKREK